MTYDHSLQIYNHILELIDQAEDLSELEKWLMREREILQKNIRRFF